MRGLKPAWSTITTDEAGRTLTGAWIETPPETGALPINAVAPSRVRGLKLFRAVPYVGKPGRTLTGAWIETFGDHSSDSDAASHPHGCVD
ncbi:hypothetical protein HMPREF1326_01768 [Akkermansia sp. KLE1605]|nr:hypothetical protein HMPREF1326_01768 [Akkermansia sp. KLE1605]